MNTIVNTCIIDYWFLHDLTFFSSEHYIVSKGQPHTKNDNNTRDIAKTYIYLGIPNSKT